MMLQSFSAPLSTASGSLLPDPVTGVLFGVAAVACVVSQFFIIRAVVRAAPSVTGSPDVPTPRRAMEIGWAILPALLIIAVFVGAWRLRYPTAPSAFPAATRGAPLVLPTRS